MQANASQCKPMLVIYKECQVNAHHCKSMQVNASQWIFKLRQISMSYHFTFRFQHFRAAFPKYLLRKMILLCKDRSPPKFCFSITTNICPGCPVQYNPGWLNCTFVGIGWHFTLKGAQIPSFKSDRRTVYIIVINLTPYEVAWFKHATVIKISKSRNLWRGWFDNNIF